MLPIGPGLGFDDGRMGRPEPEHVEGSEPRSVGSSHPDMYSINSVILAVLPSSPLSQIPEAVIARADLTQPVSAVPGTIYVDACDATSESH